jgi:hypothetical protein
MGRQSAASSSLTLVIDTDDNGADESVHYVWSGVTGAPLNRISDTTIPMVNSINSLSFSYYDASNNLLPFPVTASQVRLVAIDITAADNDEAFQLRSNIRLRNL